MECKQRVKLVQLFKRNLIARFKSKPQPRTALMVNFNYISIQSTIYNSAALDIAHVHLINVKKKIKLKKKMKQNFYFSF